MTWGTSNTVSPL